MGQEIVYPFPEGVASSKVYSLRVNQKPSFVYDAPVAPVASFGMSGPVEIEIKADRDIHWVDIRPKTLGIKASFQDSTIRFRLEKPCKISIELNGEQANKPLLIFANGPEISEIKEGNPAVRYFASGKIYYPGEIHLHSNESVFIEGGAIVYGYVTAENSDHIRILGNGILEGSKNVDFMNKNPSMFISLQDCQDIQIEGPVLINSPTWQVVPIHCNDVKIRNVKIISNNPSDDGMDLVRSKNVNIEDCFIHTKDDCIAVKSAWDYPGSEGNEAIMVTRSVFWNTEWGNALEIGFELQADTMKNIIFRDCDVIHCDDGAVFSIHNAGRAVVKNVLFDNIRVEDAHQKLFDLGIFISQYSVDSPNDPKEKSARYQNGPWDGTLHLSASEKPLHAAYRGQIRDITFRNIQVTDGLFPFSVFCGYDESHDIQNILIDNLVVHGKKITNEQDAKISRKFCTSVKIQ